MKSFTLASGLVLLFALAACGYQYDHSKPLNAGAGNATQHNAATAIIDPVPANANAGAPDFHGERAGAGIDAYATGDTEAVEVEGTDDIR